MSQFAESAFDIITYVSVKIKSHHKFEGLVNASGDGYSSMLILVIRERYNTYGSFIDAWFSNQ